MKNEIIQIILESSEEEIDEIIRENGEDPKDILKRGKEAIDKALDRFKKENPDSSKYN